MDQKTRDQSWQKELSQWKKAHDLSYKAAKLQLKFTKQIVDKLAKNGIDLEPILQKHREETEKLIDQFKKQK